jgi:hypothetical protein
VVIRCELRRPLLAVLVMVLPHGLLHVPVQLPPSFGGSLGGPYRFYIE